MKHAVALLLLCLVSIVLYAADGPSPTGQSPRFQVVYGAVEYAIDDPHPTFIRIDTWTGEAHFLNQRPVGVGNVVTQFWQAIPERP